MTYSIIKKSQLEGAERLDAEYYQPGYLNYIKNISAQSNKLGELVEFIRHPAEIERIYQDQGVPFLLTQNIEKDNFVLDFKAEKFISPERAKLISRNVLATGDIVMTRTGANYGDSAIYFGYPKNLLASAHTLIIRPKKVSSEYLVTYLNSIIGRSLVNRGVYGGLQPEITPEYIKTIPVPSIIHKQEKFIIKFIDEAYQEIKNSKNFYQQAEDLLLEELGLKDFKPEETNFATVQLSEVQKANRMDSDYFLPKYIQLMNQIKKFKFLKLGNLLKRKTCRLKIVPDQSYKYIEISDVNVGSGEVTFNEMLGTDLPVSAQIPISGNKLIVSKVRPTRGAISNIPKNWNNNFVCSGAFSAFEDKGDLDEYLFVVLRSIVGKLQMERPCTGTSYPTITDQDVENILIPILQTSTQQKIADLVKKSHSARQKSKELLSEAKRKVEKMIEKGGDKNGKSSY